MSSPFKELYESEHGRLLAMARKEKESGVLLHRAYKAFACELLERDLLWATRNLMDDIEKHLHERHQ